MIRAHRMELTNACAPHWSTPVSSGFASNHFRAATKLMPRKCSSRCAGSVRLENSEARARVTAKALKRPRLSTRARPGIWRSANAGVSAQLIKNIADCRVERVQAEGLVEHRRVHPLEEKPEPRIVLVPGKKNEPLT